MTLRYSNGQTKEAVLLSRTEAAMRVALQGADDVVELRQVNGAWVSDECEVVQVSFAWERRAANARSEEDFICPPELAARLVRMLMSADEPEESAQTSTLSGFELPAALRQVV